MAVDVIEPHSDKRFTHEHATLNGRKYHYLLAVPEDGYKHTVFLIHGWPDISMGWRYQIPLFLSLGYRVVCPDLMGFGRTEAPAVPPEPQNLYGYKRAANDIAELAKHLGASKIILGGHDWGGAVVYRTALWKPDLISHLFSVCTPFIPPAKGSFVPLEEVVNTRLPNFKYQLQLGSGEVQKHVKSKDDISQCLNGIYGGTGKDGARIFSTERGFHFENIGKMGKSPLLNDKEIEYYVDEYAHNGLDGNLNWYKTWQVNYEEDQELEQSKIQIPTLFVQATKDAALPTHMAKGMDQSIPQLTIKQVEGSHWVLWEKPAEVNDMLKSWLTETGALSNKSSL